MQSEAVQPDWPEWQSTRVAARYCGVSELTIRRAVARGALKAGRRGRLLTFKRSALDRFMSGRAAARTRATSPAEELGYQPAPIVINIVAPGLAGCVDSGRDESPTPTAAERAAQRWGLTFDDREEDAP